MNLKSAVVLAFGIVLITALCFAVENKGDDKIELYGGTRGKVPFPHHLHQNVLEDCSICHQAFPQEKGSIEKLKAEGKLKKKHVMNKQCTKCHKDMKKAGKKTGPITCKQCHIKEK